MKKVCILFGSPREEGNTAHLLMPFIKESKIIGCEITRVNLYKKEIMPCIGCRNCQKDWKAFGCKFNDDVQGIFDLILESDVLILATPIYSWYCTPPMKAVLDRLVYGMNKYYGESKGPSLWEGKKMAIICSCGYPAEKGADIFEEGIKRYCRHSKLKYQGMFVERHKGYGTVFMDKEKESNAIDFARKLFSDK